MAVLQSLIAVAYPALIYFGLKALEPRELGVLVLVLLALRVLVSARGNFKAYTRAYWLPVSAVASMATLTSISNHPLSLLLTPVAINLGLLGAFAASLFQAESTVERFAKLQAPDLSPAELQYCRRVTAVWCAFFIANGGTALGLAMLGNIELWTLYSGVVSYVLIGMMFAVEYVYRHWRFRRYMGAPGDRVLKWLFPPTDVSPPASELDPEVLHEQRGSDFIRQRLRVPAELSVWPGHFPQYFIVPGVLQLKWVTALVQDLDGNHRELLSLQGLKFKRPLLPLQEFDMAVEVSARNTDQYKFRLADGDEVISVGTIQLCTEPTP
jgi:uncharacterized membrane protein/3-hydroxymyristoyl/3-hydroxydecanoyl-(acyl carrier protein) dehydratase